MSAPAPSEPKTSIDEATVRRIARLARLAVTNEDIPHLKAKMVAVLGMAEKLASVDVNGVEPMTSVANMSLIQREDVITDGNRLADIMANAPMSEDGYFMVPKVVE
jgi:aspartyl-tRNA(Asn)/glutamyl-tRNA(Gln) amidotransferase subunit C